MTKIKFAFLIIIFFGTSANSQECQTPMGFIPIGGQEYLETMEIMKEQVKITKKFKDISLINFWALWCAPCLAELPVLAQIKKMSDDYGVYTIYAGKIPKEKKTLFIDKIGNLSPWYTPDFNIIKNWKAQGLPLSLVKTKTELFVHYGIINQKPIQLSSWLSCLTKQ